MTLRLYIAGSGPNSRRALSALAKLRRRPEAAGWHVETVDVFDEPQRAMADGILLTPQLMILSGGPPRAVIGDLSNQATLLAALGIGDFPA